MNYLYSLYVLLVLHASAGPWQAAPEIRVRDGTGSCYHHNETSYAWTRNGDHWTLGERSLTQQQVEEIRQTVLTSTSDSSGVLAAAGITPQKVAAHRDDILAAVFRGSWRTADGRTVELPAAGEHLLEHDYVAGQLLRELTEQHGAMAGVWFEVDLPGPPDVHVSGDGFVPYLLPWTVEVNGRRWRTPSIEVSKAMLLLADPEGPCAETLDGSRYWSEEVWSDELVWSRYVGRPLDEVLAKRDYERLPGYSLASERFAVDSAVTGNWSSQPLSLFVELHSRAPGLIDDVRWYDFIRDGAPMADWLDFVQAYADALVVVQRQAWLLDWKAASPDRTVDLHLSGARGVGEGHPEVYVYPPWEDAGFRGKPVFEFLLRRGGEGFATVFLGSEESGALVTRVRGTPGGGEHWLDRLVVGYHPTRPEYVRVNAAGEHELRRIE